MKKIRRPKSDNAKKKVLSIRVPDQLYFQMLAYAEQHKMTTTDIVLKGVEILLSVRYNVGIRRYKSFSKMKNIWMGKNFKTKIRRTSIVFCIFN